MPYNNLCSVYPLLRYDQDEQPFHAQHKPPSSKKVSGRMPSSHSHAEGSSSLKKGPWTAEEDAALLAHVSMHGDRNWNSVRKYTGISRCGKSCRLRWTNHLRPNLRKGPLQLYEELLIIQQHALIGNRWSRIAAMLPGRTDNEVKNFWNTRKKRFERAGLPLYSEDGTTSSVEDVKGDMCETFSNYNLASTASSKELTWNSSPRASSDAMGPSNWTYSAVSILDSKARIANLMPGFSILGRGIHGLEHAGDAQIIGKIRKDTTLTPLKGPSPVGDIHRDIHGLEHAGDAQIIGKIRKDTTVTPLKGPSPVGGSSFYNLSDGVMAQPLSKPTCLHGNNMMSSNAMLPYVPEPPDDSASFFGSPRASVSSSCGMAGSGSSVTNIPIISTSNTSSDFFSSSKQGDFLSCLKVELPSVQFAESADSSSALFSPYVTSQMLLFSEVDSLNFTSDTSVNKKNGSLFDVISQQKAPSQGRMQADVAEKTSIVSPVNASATAPSVENLLWMVNYNSLPLLGGCSPTLPNFNLNTAVQPTDLSSLGLCAGPPLLVELPTGEEAFQLNPQMQGDMPNGLEIKEQASAHKINEELVTAVGFERLKGFCGPEFYDESLYTGALLDQTEEIVMDTVKAMTSGVEYSDATSELGHSEVTSDMGDDGMISSSIKAGPWVWSYMPGIFQVFGGCDDTQK